MSDNAIPAEALRRALKGRGAASALAHRFSGDARAAVDDGWGTFEQGQAELPAQLATEVRWEDCRSALSHNQSPDVGFDRSLNPYRGCEHGCVYCYARPTHSYLNLSPGLDFETKLVAKRGFAEALRRELGSPRYRPRTIAIGTATDAYQPVERELRITRSVIELLHEVRHPLGIVTKSAGVERDIDLLAPMAAERLATVWITLTTLDAALARRLEPRAASPARRLRTVRALSEAGIPVGMSLGPQIPFLNEDMEQALDAAHAAGARSAFYTVIRLPWEVAPLFREWLEVHYPQRAARVMERIREMHGGRDYDADFATRMRGGGTWAQLIRRRFDIACRRLGLNEERLALDASQFRPPGPAGQGSLF
ncbi:PA0069 family radical SAM protein [Xylophilus sp.]|uniref:PA0069 family radical SAM protein n=1 Tax=Xylophilus sp. TaxID=2653893 RepID=UPI0013BE71DF|nr:PA0069 family radical SAM protein [Xylophilus sp.]KAF1043253.1 MAG: hypothetical protein GAK38_04052 [Xylophilus sp.]